MSENDASLLSADELAAIEDMVASGQLDTTIFNANVEAERFAIARNEESLGGSATAIFQINERFHRFFRNRLLTELDYNPRMAVAEPRLMKYDEYIHSVHSPASINITEMSPLKGETLFIIHPQVIFSCLDNWYGGQARPLSITEDRGFTSNENAIIDSLCDQLFKSMREAWAPYVEVNIRPINRDINPLFANIAADDESVVVNRFALKLSDESVDPYIDVVYTYQSLNLQRDILRSRIQSQEADENWLERLRNTVKEVDFSLLVSGGHLETTVEQLSKLSEGDILSFDPPEMAEVTVNGFPLYAAQVGIKGSKVAIKIEDKIMEREG